jgi:hypothetical protein
MVSHARRWAAGLVCVGAVMVAAGSARADDATAVPSPRYAAWAKCKPGTSATLSGDMDMGQMGKIHTEITRTLVSVTPDAATVTVLSKITMMGTERPGRTRTETIPAKEPPRDMKQTGTVDVEAMGKSYKCKVYEATGAAAGQASPVAGRPGMGGPGAPAGYNPADAKATAYISDDVPGGMVKLEVTGAAGKLVTFVLTAVDVK